MCFYRRFYAFFKQRDISGPLEASVFFVIVVPNLIIKQLRNLSKNFLPSSYDQLNLLHQNSPQSVSLDPISAINQKCTRKNSFCCCFFSFFLHIHSFCSDGTVTKYGESLVVIHWVKFR